MAGFPGGPSDQQRLDSWKEIGAFFGRDERTVKRWERERGLPVHRVPGSGRGRVYAYSHELKEWLRGAGAEALEGVELSDVVDAPAAAANASGKISGTAAAAERASAATSVAIPEGDVEAGAVWSGEERRKREQPSYPEARRESFQDLRRNDSAHTENGRGDAGRSERSLGSRASGLEAGTDSGAGRAGRLSLVYPSRESVARDSTPAREIADALPTDAPANEQRAEAIKAQAGESSASSAGAGKARTAKSLAERWAVGAVAVAVVAAGTAGYFVHREHIARAAVSNRGVATAAAHAEAEDLYLKGVYYWQKRTPESLRQAVDYYTQAIVHDPGYAPAYAGLAECYDLLREYTDMPEAEAYPRAIAAAERAIALDPNLAQAHSALGFALFWWQRDIPRAMSEMEQALRLDPRSATAHHWYATALLTLGRKEQALQQIEMARKLDPGSEAILADKAYILWGATGSEEAKQALHQLEKSNPTYFSPHRYLADIAFQQGDGRTYVTELRAAAALKPDAQQTRLADLAEKSFAEGGWPAVLQALYSDAREQYAAGQASAMTMAVWEARMGHRDAALHYLNEAVKANDPGLMFMLSEPEWAPLRDTEQYKIALEKAGLV
jgi:tetratricopeptide (TPR) repeat protein